MSGTGRLPDFLKKLIQSKLSLNFKQTYKKTTLTCLHLVNSAMTHRLTFRISTQFNFKIRKIQKLFWSAQQSKSYESTWAADCTVELFGSTSTAEEESSPLSSFLICSLIFFNAFYTTYKSKLNWNVCMGMYKQKWIKRRKNSTFFGCKLLAFLSSTNVYNFYSRLELMSNRIEPNFFVFSPDDGILFRNIG